MSGETASRPPHLLRYSCLPAVAVCVAVLIYQQYEMARMQVQIGFAREQIDVFFTQTVQSRTANAAGKIAAVNYLRNYYPSGTKQEKGSDIDQIVEACRHFAIDAIKHRPDAE